MKPTAWITLRLEPPYRSDAFAAGFEAMGLIAKMVTPENVRPRPGDVVVVWNLNPRYRPAETAAKSVEVPLLVAENGYIPRAGDTTLHYALARNGHNGSGFWYVGKEDRWGPLNRTIEDWQDRPDGYILIADQRGIGSEIMRCPHAFYETVAPKIRRIFKDAGKPQPEIRLREHPGRHAPKQSLAADLAGARALVTWASNVANEALLAGVPTFRIAPYHVNEAALHDITHIINPPKTDRLPAFQKLAWAQWALPEIESGEPFRHLLRDRL